MPVSLRALSLLALALVASSCARRVAPDDVAESLAGLEVPLRTTGGVRVSVDGSVEGRPAELVLEVALPRSTVTAGCFDSLPEPEARVRFAVPEGGMQEAGELDVHRVVLGARKVGAVRAALVEGEACILTLGSDQLGPYALTIEPARRTLRLEASRTREEWLAEAGSKEALTSGLEFHVLEVVRDPNNDWPMIAARAKQGTATVTGPYVVVTGQAESYLDAAAAKDVGLQRGPDFLRELGFPSTVELPASLGGDVFTLERLELTPGFGLRFTGLKAVDDWSNPGAVGLLGGDVWGRFRTTLDVNAGVLLLRRPRVLMSGSRQRCATPEGAWSEEACFDLHQRDRPDGVEWGIAIWRDLARGARLYFDVVDEQGNAVGGLCRVGMTFARSDRGISAAHVVPWQGLERSVPGCAEALQGAAEVRFAVWEEGALPECPGTCAFVQDLASDRVSCECQSASGITGEHERRFMEMFRDVIQKKRDQPGETEPAEPADPD